MTKLAGQTTSVIVQRDFPTEYAELVAGIEKAGGSVADAVWQVNRDFYRENGLSSSSITVTTVQYVDHRIHKKEVPLSKGEILAVVREKRNRLLAESDWTQMPDAPVDREAWAEYRQQLRDITNTTPVVWPQLPK